MKLAVVGQNSPALAKRLEARGVALCAPADSDLLIPYGGDGTLLGAERDFPGVRKYPIRDEETAPLCAKHKLAIQLDALFAGQLKLSQIKRLKAEFGSAEIYAMNDIFIHNKNNASALRYKIWIDGELYSHEIVGDGVGVATVHGSTAYFRSITHSVFRVGIGLAFSNSTELVNHMILPETSEVRVKINRGPGEMVADNYTHPVLMQVGDECRISLSREASEFLGMDIFMCPECRRLRHEYRHSFFKPEGAE